jgi:lipopolysaccharide transport system permease protein
MPHAFHARSHHGARSPLLTPWRSRDLIAILAWREVAGRYRGSLLGSLWPVLTPLIMLGVYTVVFGVILPSRWPAAGEEGMGGFALRLLSGMLVHGLLAEVWTRAPTLFTGNPNYVTKMVFPLEVLAWVNLGAALFHVALAMVVMLLVNGVVGTGFDVTQLALPLLLVPLCLFLVGSSLLLAGLGVYVRDIGQVIGPMVVVLMFLGPVFYPRAAMPESMQAWLALNPVTIPIEQFRRALFQGLWPEWGVVAQYSLVAVLVYLAGVHLFRILRKGFADVL